MKAWILDDGGEISGFLLRLLVDAQLLVDLVVGIERGLVRLIL
jgi:hypothetical protein